MLDVPVCSLDPDNDPLCMLLLIDFLCLRCREYTFLIRLYDEWEVRHLQISSVHVSQSGINICGCAVLGK